MGLRKKGLEIHWSCDSINGLGACSEVVSLQEKNAYNLEFLRLLEVDCGEGHVLQGIQAEVDTGADSMRLKASCCYLAQLPVALRPYNSFEDSGDLGNLGAAGIYFPTGVDDSGRPEFQQGLTFKPKANVSGALSYDKFAGTWCITGATASCSSVTDVVHPLDLGRGALGSLHVMPITDFNALFEGHGSGATTTQKPSPVPPKPPALETLAAAQPEYAEVCKDEHMPGVLGDGFKQEGMHDAAKALTEGHPCYYIWSDVRQTPDDDEDKGTWAHFLKHLSWCLLAVLLCSMFSDVLRCSPPHLPLTPGNSWFPREGGPDESAKDVTYKSIWECAERAGDAEARPRLQDDDGAVRFVLGT